MGAGSARAFERGDAGRLIHVDARWGSRVHVADPKHGGVRRIKIGIQNAALPTELKLEAGAFAHLQRRLAKVSDQFRRSHADQRGLTLDGSHLCRLLWCGCRLRSWSAGGYGEAEEED